MVRTVTSWRSSRSEVDPRQEGKRGQTPVYQLRSGSFLFAVASRLVTGPGLSGSRLSKYLGLESAPTRLRVDAGLRLAGLRSHRELAEFVRLEPTDPSRDRLRDKRVIEDPEARESFHREIVVPTIDIDQIIATTADVLCIDSAVLRGQPWAHYHASPSASSWLFVIVENYLGARQRFRAQSAVPPCSLLATSGRRFETLLRSQSWLDHAATDLRSPARGRVTPEKHRDR